MSERGNNDNSRQSAESELLEFCLSDSLSKKGLREIIERHKLAPHNRVNDYQFFLEACYNKRVTVGIIQYLLEYFPDSIRATDHNGSPLHNACLNKNMTLDIIQLLIDGAPDSVRSVDENGNMPLHNLCDSKSKDDRKAMQILKLLIEKCPEAVRHAENGGFLPIHMVSVGKAPELCRLLIEAYPGSERITDSNGALPFHCACLYNTVATVEYLYKLYPNAINHTTTTDGYYPTHLAIMGVEHRDDPIAAVGTVKYLLDLDPSVKFQKRGRKSLLHYACQGGFNDKTIEAALKVIKLIYDAHPEAIESNRIASNIQSYHEQVQAFINSELVYSRQATDHRQMTTPDGNGQLPLHTAVQNNATLGSIKLLVKGNPAAAQSPDNSGALPLHVACQRHESADVIQYLIGLDITTLDAVDRDGNTALHFACHCARHEFIALLLGKYNGVSVSKRNAHGRLPIDLLWESNVVLDRDSVEYTESVFRLLKAYPEMVMTTDMQSDSVAHPSQNRKKRKFDHED